MVVIPLGQNSLIKQFGAGDPFRSPLHCHNNFVAIKMSVSGLRTGMYARPLSSSNEVSMMPVDGLTLVLSRGKIPVALKPAIILGMVIDAFHASARSAEK